MSIVRRTQWDECLQMLGEEDLELAENLQSAPELGEGKINYKSALCLLRAQAYDALENRPRAVHWYKVSSLRRRMLFNVQNNYLHNDFSC